MYILSAFVIVYGLTIGTTKKPFNPLLGETYEYTDPLFNTKIVMEQVSHHPPVSAFHIESDDFIFTGCISIKTLMKLSGVQVVTLENSHLVLKSTQDVFEIIRHKSTVHNLVLGDMYVWTEGNAICKNLNSGHQAMMYLHPVERFKKKDYRVDGKVLDPQG